MTPSKEELIEVKDLAVDKDGKMLVGTGAPEEEREKGRSEEGATNGGRRRTNG